MNSRVNTKPLTASDLPPPPRAIRVECQIHKTIGQNIERQVISVARGTRLFFRRNPLARASGDSIFQYSPIARITTP